MSFNKFDHTITGEVLPRFRLRVENLPDPIFEEIKTAAIPEPTVSGTYADKYTILRIPSWERNYWSPELQIHSSPDYDNKSYTILRCVVGPSQSVWVMFIFFYSITILVTLFGGMFGMVQYSIENDSTFLWIWPIGIAVFLTLFIVSKIGQRKARNQTLHLVSFLLHTLERKWKVERVD